MKFEISGMMCAGCSAKVEKVVSELEGVTKCEVNLLTASMNVQGTASAEKIIQAVQDAGYGARLIKEDDAPSSLTEQNSSQIKKLVLRLSVSIILLAVLMSWNNSYAKACLSVCIMLINFRFFVSGIKSLFHLSPNMDTLVALGSIASFSYGSFDGAGMILTLITIGKTLESIAKGRTTNAIKDLIKLTPKTAVIRKDEGDVVVEVSKIQVGDIFIVKPGNNIPVDGFVIEGESTVDESSMTGESEPSPKSASKKSEVTAGTTNLEGLLICKATRVGQDTSIAQIVKLVSDSAASKAPVQKVTDKVSAIFVPVIIGLAIVTTVTWVILGQDFEFALMRGISVLVISCPCALGLATPVAIMVGNGVGARKGILFKNSQALELTGKAKIVVLDKTGTITKEKDEVRPDSKQAIAELRNLGIKVVMLTGDTLSNAKKIAAKVTDSEQDITVVAEVLPDQKASEVAKLQKEGTVIMVGDGINDAPALTTADVGLAIGAGSDIAIDSADVVLVKSSLMDVVEAIKLSKSVLKNIKENLFWAFFYNSLGIPVAAGCFIAFGITLTPAISALCMSLSSLCVVSNALRLNWLSRK